MRVLLDMSPDRPSAIMARVVAIDPPDGAAVAPHHQLADVLPFVRYMAGRIEAGGMVYVMHRGSGLVALPSSAGAHS